MPSTLRQVVSEANRNFAQNQQHRKQEWEQWGKNINKTELASVAIEAMFGSLPAELPQHDLDKIRQRLVDAAVNNNLGQVINRDWTHAPYVFLSGEPKLLGMPTFVNAYIDWINRNRTSRNIKRLIFGYLYNFELFESHPDAFQRLATVIRYALVLPRIGTLQSWQNIQAEFGLFKGQMDVEQTADRYLQDKYKGKANQFLADCGLTGQLQSIGYAKCIAKLLLRYLKNCDNDKIYPKIWEWAKEFVWKNDGKYLDNLIFQSLKKEFAEAFLHRWLPNVQQKPPELLRQQTEKMLLKTLGDVRLLRYQNNWRNVDEKYKQVFRQWLVRNNFALFFEIIGKTVDKPDQWKYRKAFWQAYLDKGYIDDAWVVLGADAQAHITRLSGKEAQVYQQLAYGRLTGSDANNKSVILLKIGDFIFMEVSHDGKCRAWGPSLKQPPLHSPDLDRQVWQHNSEIIKEGYRRAGIAHQEAEKYFWQKTLSEFIRSNTGRAVSPHDYQI